LADGKTYSEGHHLRPLGRPHDGPDVPANILVVCPNCHVMLDRGAVVLEREAITVIAPHDVAEEYLSYHNDLARKLGAT
jgi:predicted restriction endonuclease